MVVFDNRDNGGGGGGGPSGRGGSNVGSARNLGMQMRKSPDRSQKKDVLHLAPGSIPHRSLPTNLSSIDCSTAGVVSILPCIHTSKC